MNTKQPLFRNTIPALALCIAAGLAASHCFAKPAHAKSDTHKPVADKAPAAATGASSWIPNPKLVPQLDRATHFGIYTLRLPIGYTVDQQDMSTEIATITGYSAKGASRADGSFPVLFVIVSEAKPGAAPTDLETILSGNPFLSGKTDIVKSSPESGSIGDLAAMRQYYKFPVTPGSAHFLHGFHYASATGQNAIIVAALDGEPYSAKTLPLAEAAALTLQKSE